MKRSRFAPTTSRIHARLFASSIANISSSRTRPSPGAFRAIVPEPLKPERNLVHYDFVRMTDSLGFGDYTESGQVISVCETHGRLANHTHSMLFDDGGTIAGNREIWSFPNKRARPMLAVDGNDSLLGTPDYCTRRSELLRDVRTEGEFVALRGLQAYQRRPNTPVGWKSRSNTTCRRIVR